MNAPVASRMALAIFLIVGVLVLFAAARRSAEANPIIQGRPARQWIAELAALDMTVRQRAADVLRHESTLAVPVLTKALSTRGRSLYGWFARQGNRFAPGRFPLVDHAAERSAVARLLGSLGEAATPAMPALIACTIESEWRVREDAAVALMELGVLAAAPLAATLTSAGDQAIALRSAEILQRMGSDSATALQQIISAFTNGPPQIQMALAPVLGQEWAGTETVIATLTAAAESSQERVQIAALRALGNHRNLTEPARLTIEHHQAHASMAVRFAAAAAWAQRSPDLRQALPQLRAGLRVEALRAEAVTILGRLGPVAEPAVSDLLDVLVHERNPRPLRMPPGAGLALSQIGGPALDGVLKLLNHSNELTRVNAVVTVGLFGQRAHEYGNALVSLLADPQADVRQAAALCLSSIGWHVRDAVPVLQALLREDDPFMVTWAGDALEKIDPTLIPERSAR